MMRKKCGRPGSSGLSTQVIKDLEREISTISQLVNSANIRLIIIDKKCVSLFFFHLSSVMTLPTDTFLFFLVYSSEQPIYMNQNMKDYLSEWKSNSNNNSSYDLSSLGGSTSSTSGSFSNQPIYNSNNNYSTSGSSMYSNNNNSSYTTSSSSSSSSSDQTQHIFAIKLRNLQRTVSSLVSFFPEMKRSSSIHIKSNVTLFSCYHANNNSNSVSPNTTIQQQQQQSFQNNNKNSKNKNNNNNSSSNSDIASPLSPPPSSYEQNFTVAFYALYDRDMFPSSLMMMMNSVDLLTNEDHMYMAQANNNNNNSASSTNSTPTTSNNNNNMNNMNNNTSSPLSQGTNSNRGSDTSFLSTTTTTATTTTTLGSSILHNLDTRLVDVGMQNVLTNINLILGTAMGLIPLSKDSGNNSNNNDAK